MPGDSSPAPVGRKRITTRAELEQVAFGLFDRQGFAGTTIGDIARAAGIGSVTATIDSSNRAALAPLRRCTRILSIRAEGGLLSIRAAIR